MKIRSSIGLLASGTAMALLMCPNFALAASIEWSGAAGNSWFVNGNWIGGSIPASLDNATIDTGTAEIAGSGSAAEVDMLTLGHTGTGALQVETGGSFTADGSLTLGDTTSGSGSITVNGTSHFTADSLIIGNNGSGRFEVTAGATAQVDNDAFIAGSGGSSGSASISGGGTTWIIDGDLDVGGAGVGTMEISTGATVSDTNATVGAAARSSGSSVTISGLGSSWTNSNQLIVGDSGNAALGIFSAAIVSSASAVIGRHATATVSVGGSGSLWTSGALLVGGDSSDAGASGTGTLDISAGGTVDTTSATLGDTAGSSGTVTIDGSGSRWDISGLANVGGDGTGEVKVTNGADVTSAGARIGAQSGGSGDVLVTGGGSNWNSSSAFYVGYAGSGSLEITASGTLSSADGYVGYGSSGSAFVDGLGSSWTNAGTLRVGTNTGSSGTVTISGAGKISDVDGIVGDGAGSSGTVTVSGSGSSWINSGNVDVGLLGDGTLDVILGGNVSGVTGSIGSGSTGTGLVKVTGDGSAWTSSGNLIVGDAGDGTLTIADGGTVSAASVTIAAQGGSTGTVNIGAALGQTAAGYATLDANAIHFGSGAGTLVFNFGGPAYVTSAVIDGDGTIDVAEGNVTLNGNSGAFSGTTNVSGGSLSVDGRLGGDLFVSGGTLAGTGTVGTTQVSSGGTISPGGSSTGTLTVDGNLALASGSTYRADVASSGSDSIHATGTTTISSGSTLDLVGGSSVSLGSHTILSANGGLTGTFSSVTSETTYAFIDPSLAYDGGAVAVDYSRNDVSFASAGQTGNQSSVGGAVESLGSGNTLYDAVVGLASGEVSGASKQLAGDLHTSSTTMTFDNSRFSRTVGIDRLRSAFGDAGASGGTTYVLGAPASGGNGALGYAEANQSQPTSAELATQSILADPRTAPAVVWAEGYGGWGRTDGDANASGVTSSTGGVMFGIDGPVADSSWRVGVMGGYSRTNFDQDGENSSGDSDNYDIGVYGGNRWGPLALRLGALYTRQNLSTQRSVVFPGFAETLGADYDADSAQAFGELGYTIDSGPVKFEPFGNLAYVHLHTDGFSESGGSAALNSDAENSGITFTTLGLRSSRDFMLGGVAAVARGSLGWRHAFGDTDTLSTFSFAGGSDFTVAGNAVARDALVLEAGMDFTINPFFTVGLTYSGDYAKAAINQTVKTTLSMKF
jgi:outer membrane autotransporter protein